MAKYKYEHSHFPRALEVYALHPQPTWEWVKKEGLAGPCLRTMWAADQ